MGIDSFRRFGSTSSAILLLAGCAGNASQQIAPGLALPPSFRAHGDMPVPLQSRVERRSWMSPAAKNVKELLYISGAVTNTVYVYDYKTKTLVGELTGFDQPSGQCVDAKGDIWITDWQSFEVSEYAHGGTSPIAVLKMENLQTGCSIDPTTGDLAVSNADGLLDIWKKARGRPKEFASRACPVFWAPGYDNHGNLFVESAESGFGAYVCGLPHGGRSLQVVPFNQTINYGAGAMWDGKYMTFGDQLFNGPYDAQGGPAPLEISGVYRAAENASGGLTLVGAAPGSGSTRLYDSLCGASDVAGFFIVGTKNTPVNVQEGTVLIGSNNSCSKEVDLWAYPAAGTPSVMHPDDDVPSGVSVSIEE